jgi:hypothetical protein
MDDMIRPLSCLLLVVAVTARAETAGDQLEADHAAWTVANRSYDQRIERGDIDATEKRDYQAFLADLAQRVAAGCAELQELERPIPAGVDCPEGNGQAGGVVFVAPTTATTRGEGREALDAELGASLGQFDEMLLREQDRVRAARPLSEAAGGDRGGSGSSSASSGGEGQGEGASASASRADGSSDGQGEGQGREGAESSTASASGQGGTGGLPPSMNDGRGEDDVQSDGGSLQGDPGQGGLGPPSGQAARSTRPADLPDASGDDVVARQLREAAERERDPELKARLWEEYRRYRGG